MVTLVSLLDVIYGELRTVVTENASVSTPNDHVGMLNRTTDYKTPFFGFEWSKTPNERGMSGNVRVVEEIGSNDSIDSIERARDYILSLDVGVIVDGDQPRQRDLWLEDVEIHFSDFVADPNELHVDVGRVRDAGTIPGTGADGRDMTVRTSYEIEFTTVHGKDATAVDSVDLDVDADAADAYPEKY